jgi:hypothetical protein
MTTTQIKAATQKMTFAHADTLLVTRTGLTLSLIRDMRCEKLYRVEGHATLNYISISLKSLLADVADVRFINK